MSQLIAILLLVVAVVRAVTKSKGKGAKPPQRPVRLGQSEPGSETEDAVPLPRAKSPHKPVRAVQSNAMSEEVLIRGFPGSDTPRAEPSACGNAREHSHARAEETAFTANDLRRAVITSEILSKPVSLRDE